MPLYHATLHRLSSIALHCSIVFAHAHMARMHAHLQMHTYYVSICHPSLSVQVFEAPTPTLHAHLLCIDQIVCEIYTTTADTYIIFTSINTPTLLHSRPALLSLRPLSPCPSGLRDFPPTMNHHIFVHVGERKKFASHETTPESLRECLLLGPLSSGIAFQNSAFSSYNRRSWRAASDITQRS